MPWEKYALPADTVQDRSSVCKRKVSASQMLLQILPDRKGRSGHMLNTNVFDYVNVLNKAADASWTRNSVLSNNIANVDTPGYKRQDVDFESQLKQALRSTRYKSVDARVNAINDTELETTVYTDATGFSYRLDGNNVDIDTESAKLAENQIKYQGLVECMNQEFSNLKLVMK